MRMGDGEKPPPMIKRILKEPLLHFLALGAVIFLTYSFVSKHSSTELGTIVITQGQIDSLAKNFARTWQRSPAADELTNLIRDRVREEVLYREALALGLDREDTVIRRRLRQKMEFISHGIAALTEPTDAELGAWLQAHADKFRVEPRLTFRQVYFDPQKHGEYLSRDVAQLLQQLNQAGDQADISRLGDSLMLGQMMEAVPFIEIANQFGKAFARNLVALPLMQWQGPVESGYGLHLVFVSQRSESRQPALAEVRDVVRREWENARQVEANEKFYAELLKRYTVVIEPAKPTDGG